MRLQEAFGHPLNARVRVRAQPGSICRLEAELPVISRAMIPLTDVIQYNLPAFLFCNPEPHRIPSALDGKAWTAQGVPQIAAILEMTEVWSLTLMAGRGAMATPARTQRKARRMQPGPFP